MVLVLVLVVIMFAVNTNGVMLLPQNVNNLVAQNAYVFILATGMLFCILTGGNIDLSVGSVVCFVAAVGGKMMVLNSMNPYLTPDTQTRQLRPTSPLPCIALRGQTTGLTARITPWVKTMTARSIL